MTPMTLKQQLHELIDSLPEDNAIEELQYRLYVMRKVEKAFQSIDAGRGIEHQLVRERLSARLDNHPVE